jgi:peptidoglycan/xylan/chitin deacetylase (PgdA/CDA1 family)
MDSARSEVSLSLIRRRAKVLSPLVRRLAYLSGLSAHLARRQGATRILMLHAVGSEARGVLYPSILNVYPARVFEAELRYLSRHFSIVPLANIVEGIERNTLGSSHEIALTFDDGLRNNALVAYRILQRLRLPATFFVCPGLMESGRWAWPYDILARLTYLPPSRRMNLLRRLESPEETIVGVLEWMKGLQTASRMTVEDRIREATSSYAPTPEERHLFDTMTWEELASLDPGLITVGSHSMSHPSLNRVSHEQAAIEIRESRHVLERRLQRPISYFCYPDGRFDEAAVELTRQHYLAAVTTRAGFISAKDDLHLLPRIGAGAERVHDLAWRLHRPRS